MATTTIYPFGQGGSVISSGGFILVDELPTASAATTGSIYLVPSGTGNTKNMWLTVQQNGAFVWTQIGSTDVNLDGYATEQWVMDLLPSLTQEQYRALVDSGQIDPNKYYFVDEEQI